MLKVFAEERLIGEVQLVGYHLLNALLGRFPAWLSLPESGCQSTRPPSFHSPFTTVERCLG